jgi:aminocarboxymuconate-semialdehyde decarboxylase
VPIIDTHAHLTPEPYKLAIANGDTWHGLGPKAGGVLFPGFALSVDERLAQMDGHGIDIQLITPTVGFFQYHNDLDVTRQIARECNDEIADVVATHPTRFRGLATLPMQDVEAAIAELERAMGELGMEGAILSDHVNGKTYDSPDFRELFARAEALGALLMFHQGGDTVVDHRIKRFSLGNAVGNLTERTLVFAALVFSGVMDDFPGLKVLLAHGGGFVTMGVHRLDKVAGALEGGYPESGLVPPFGFDPDTDFRLPRPPSRYLDRFYYDTCVYNGDVLRFIIDSVGVDRVMLGTDDPAPMVQDDPVRWLNGLPQLTADEKQAILFDNATVLLRI